MHGVPADYVEHATTDQLRVLWEIVIRDQKQSLEGAGTAVALGIGQAFGGA